jgi:hypothetical protein
MSAPFEGVSAGMTVDEAAVDRAIAWMGGNVNSLAQAIANRQHMEQWLKVVEATEKAKRREEPAHVQERDARASDDYKLALEAFKTASQEEQRLRYTWQLADTVIACWQTKSANTRRAVI